LQQKNEIITILTSARERFGVLAPCFTGEANSAGKLTTHKEEK
jgi:hypothetical protein